MDGQGEAQALASLKDTAIFARGSDVLGRRVRLAVQAAPPGHLFYLDDFRKLGRYQSVKKAVEQLVKEGLLVKVKAYPVFYEKVRV